MALTQLVERGVAANLEAVMEHDATRAQSLDTPHDDGFFEFEAGNAIGQQPTCAVVAVINMDFITAHTQQFRRRQPRWARADHADRLSLGWTRHNRFDPALFPRGIGNELFDRPDGDCAVAREFDDAIALAQSVLRANAATDFGHRRGRVRQLIGLAQPPLRRQPQPVGDVVVQRAVHRAIGDAAL